MNRGNQEWPPRRNVATTHQFPQPPVLLLAAMPDVAQIPEVRLRSRASHQEDKFAKPFRVTNGKKFRLKDIDPGDTLGLGSEDKPRARETERGKSPKARKFVVCDMSTDYWPCCCIAGRARKSGNGTEETCQHGRPMSASRVIVLQNSFALSDAQD
jgi:hypothetical protein